MAFINKIETFYPNLVVSNETIIGHHPKWSAKMAHEKLGIKSRHVLNGEEDSRYLAKNAASSLLEKCNYPKIDLLIYCTQSPEKLIPTTACILHKELNLPKECGAIEYNLGCSGFVYGLSIAKAFIESKIFSNILLVTADSYTKHISQDDISNRLIFGDAGTATLISNSKGSHSLQINTVDLGTDGSGNENLTSGFGGMSSDNSFLCMNGPEIMNFALREVPLSMARVAEKENQSINDYDYYVFHQANKFMLNSLMRKLNITQLEKSLENFEDYGNTVSSTIPIVLKKYLEMDFFQNDEQLLISGFGVGYSWASMSLKFKK